MMKTFSKRSAVSYQPSGCSVGDASALVLPTYKPLVYCSIKFYRLAINADDN
jgi:hypothetical protein